MLNTPYCKHFYYCRVCITDAAFQFLWILHFKFTDSVHLTYTHHNAHFIITTAVQVDTLVLGPHQVQVVKQTSTHHTQSLEHSHVTVM